MKIYDIKTKIVKTVFTLISVGLLFANWIVVYGDFEYNWMEYRSEIVSGLEGIKMFGNLFGQNYNIDGIEKIVDCVLDGKLSAVEFSIIATEVDAFIQIDENGLNEDVISTIRITFGSYLVLFYGTIIIALVMLYNVWKKSHAFLEKLFWGLEVAIGFVACCLCLATTQITSQLGSEQFFIVRPTIWLVLAVACAAPTDLLQKLPIYNYDVIKSEILKKTTYSSSNATVKHENRVQNAIENKWSCNQCGSQNSVEARFCSVCGKKKAEIVICTKCGARMWDDEECKFCKQEKKDEKVCSSCGCIIDKNSSFCQYCGIKI